MLKTCLVKPSETYSAIMAIESLLLLRVLISIELFECIACSHG